MTPRPRAALRIAAALGFILLVVLVATAAPEKKLDHDEHQFIASGYLLAHHGLLPYLDYPYFHVPYLIAPYALLFLLNDHLLFTARLFSVLCSLITLALVARYALMQFDRAEVESRFGFVLGTALLLVGSPLFVYTSGLSWNHDASIMLSVAGTLTVLTAVRSSQSPQRAFVPGLLFGLAIGTRLSALPLLVPVFVYLARVSGGDRRGAALTRLVWLGLGIAVALLPMLALLAADPEKFLFGNLGYAGLNTAYRELTGYRRAMSLPGKAIYFVERVLSDPGNLVLFLLLGLVLFRIGVSSLRHEGGRETLFLVALVAFAFLGALAPTPSFPQYFFATIPFTLLAAVHAIGLLLRRPSDRSFALRVFLIAVIVCGLRAVPAYWSVYQPLSTELAPAKLTHRLGTRIRERVEAGAVLTLAPIFPLEGGLDIYAPLATGPFAWRTAALLSPAKRERFGVVAPAELSAALNERPPAAVLVGLERGELERPLIDYVRENGFRAVRLDDRATLWIAPPRRSNLRGEEKASQEDAVDPR